VNQSGESSGKNVGQINLLVLLFPVSVLVAVLLWEEGEVGGRVTTWVVEAVQRLRFKVRHYITFQGDATLTRVAGISMPRHHDQRLITTHLPSLYPHPLPRPFLLPPP